MKKFRKSSFNIDDGEMLNGYTNGSTWNGWACPYFDFENATKLANQFMDNDDSKMLYDTKKDTFFYKVEWDEIVEEWMGEDIEVNGEIVHVYPIGAYCWVWDEWTKEELERLEKIRKEGEEEIFISLSYYVNS